MGKLKIEGGDPEPEDKRDWRWYIGSMIGFGDFAAQFCEDPIKSDKHFVVARRLTKIAVTPRGLAVIKWIGYSENLIAPAETDDRIKWEQGVESVMNRDQITFTFDCMSEMMMGEIERLWGIRQIETVSKGGVALPPAPSKR